MKQYTSNDQTAKLIELGFDRPKNRVIKQLLDRSTDSWITIGEEGDYFIGELIEMLPDVIELEDSEYATLQMYFDVFNWVIEYTGVEKTEYATSAIELIDALCDMLVKLKEERVI